MYNKKNIIIIGIDGHHDLCWPSAVYQNCWVNILGIFDYVGTHTCDGGDKNSSTIPTMIMNTSCVHRARVKIFYDARNKSFF